MFVSALKVGARPAYVVAAAAVGAASVAVYRSREAFAPSAFNSVALAKELSQGALNPQEWRSFKLAEKEQLTPNTFKFRFQLPEPDQVVGLPVASCLVTRAPIGEEKPEGGRKMVVRPYTPTSPPDAKGHFDLVIKVYPTGKMSKHIGSLQPGDSLDAKGPIAKLPYTKNMKKQIGMIAGGTGITPMLQVAFEILRNPEDSTQVSLIYANQSEQDIILKDNIDQLAKKFSNFKVYYVVDKAINNEWKGGVGYVTKDMLRQHLPTPASDNLILVCGPPPMMKSVSGDKAEDKTQGELTGLLKDLGYSKEQVFKF